MITEPQAGLRYFGLIHRGTMRGILALREPDGFWSPARRRGPKVLEHPPNRSPHHRLAHVFLLGLPGRGPGLRLGRSKNLRPRQ